MNRALDIEANLTLEADGSRISLTAQDGRMIVHLHRRSLGTLARQMVTLDRSQILERAWRLSKALDNPVYLKYGPFRMRMPRPWLCRSMLRFLSALRVGGRRS